MDSSAASKRTHQHQPSLLAQATVLQVQPPVAPSPACRLLGKKKDECGRPRWRSLKSTTSGSGVFWLSILYVLLGVFSSLIRRWFLRRKSGSFEYPIVSTLLSWVFNLVVLVLGSVVSPQRVRLRPCPTDVRMGAVVLVLAVVCGGNSTLDAIGIALLPVAVVKIVRMSKPLFAAAFAFVLLGERTARVDCVLMLVVGIGAALTVHDIGYLAHAPVGLGCVLVATALSALHFVIGAHLMHKGDVGPATLMFWLGTPIIVALVALLLIGHVEDLPQALRELAREPPVLGQVLFGCVVTFAHSLVEWVLVQRASPVFCALLICFKVPILLVATVLFFGLQLTVGQWAGIVLAISGFIILQMRASVRGSRRRRKGGAGCSRGASAAGGGSGGGDKERGGKQQPYAHQSVYGALSPVEGGSVVT